MAFKKQVPTLDLDTTAFENIFLTEFLPVADEIALKVYLLGYHYACDIESHSRFSNEALSRHLNISITDVLRAWQFWEDRGLIKKIDTGSDYAADFSVEFISVRQLYIESNYSPKHTPAPKASKPSSNSPAKLTGSLNEPVLKKMFRDIELLLNRPLEPNDCFKILDWIDTLAVDPATILKAFEVAVKENNVRNINYVAGVLRNWADSGQTATEPPPPAATKKSKPVQKQIKSNRFHNFEGRYSKMSDDELEALIKNRKSLWGKDDSH